MNRSTFRGLAVCIAAVSLASCQEYDGGFSESKIKEAAYAKNFVKAFGEVDPNQDFNLATRATANVNLDEVAQVKIYTLNPMVKGAKLIADIPSDKVSTFNFDMIEGTSEVFVQAVSKRGAIINGYMPVTDGVLNINSGKVQTRASGTCNTTIGTSKQLNVYYSDAYTDHVVTKNFNIYSLENVSSSRSTPWRLGDFRKVLDTYKDGNGDDQDGVFKEGKNNWRDWVKTGRLANNVQFTMASDGPVSVTLNYRQTGTYTNQLCYFYYTGDVYPTAENIKLYSLIPNATGNNDLVRKSSDNGGSYENVSGSGSIWGNNDDMLVQGTTFDLVYFGEDGNCSGTYTFPQDVHIGFAVVQDNNATGLNPNATDKTWFSIQEMNPPSANWWKGDAYNNQNFPAAATFKIGDVTFLGFEDWPDNTEGDGGGSDLNDLLFFAVGNFQEEIPDIDPDPDPDPEPEPQEWMLVYEDLGNSFDWDYNDVVLKVGHTVGSGKLIITPMAAGGTLASYVKFNGSNVGAGEIHQLLGATAQNSGSYTPINADSRADGTPIEITLTEDQDAAFSMTTLGAIGELGGITLHVVPSGNAGETGIESSTVIAYSLDNKGKAPEVICLPASWNYTNSVGMTMSRTFRWPAELQHIDDAYSNFTSWVSNKSSNTDWYKADPDLDYCASGTFEEEVSEPAGDDGGDGNGSSGGSGSGDDGQDTVNPELTTTITEGIENNMVLSADYFPSTCTKATISFTHDDSSNRMYIAFMPNNAWSFEFETSTANETISHELSSVELSAAKAGNLKLTSYDKDLLQYASRIVIETE